MQNAPQSIGVWCGPCKPWHGQIARPPWHDRRKRTDSPCWVDINLHYCTVVVFSSYVCTIPYADVFITRPPCVGLCQPFLLGRVNQFSLPWHVS